MVTFFYGNGSWQSSHQKVRNCGRKTFRKNTGSSRSCGPFSTSPIIHDGILYMQVFQRDTKVGSKGSNDNRSYL
ncbi:MAG: hypothetical protein CM1200mP29_12270 [Verrucomicrobiota bacterium]|nr:MAG: hypothetical protein CM1200mP29_12270 [Verrucomicrobiota bacterium]